MSEPLDDRELDIPSKRKVYPSGAYLPALRWHWLTPAYDFAVRVTSGERRFKECLLDFADLQPHERVIDVGCGTGTLLIAAHERQERALLCGLDRDAPVLRKAARKLHRQHRDLDLCQTDAQQLPIASASIDVALSSLFFHHLSDEAKSAVLREIARVLRPHGRLVIADWGAPRSTVSRLGASFIRNFDGAEPTRTNLAGRLPALIADAGFTRVETVAQLGVPLGVIDVITCFSPIGEA